MADLYCMYASRIYIIPHRLDRPNRPNRLDRRGDQGDLGDLDVTCSYRPNRLDRLAF